MASSAITMEQACQILQITRRQLMRRIMKNDYPRPPKLGRDYQISAEWVRDVMKNREIELKRDKIILQLHKEAQEMLERVDTETRLD